MIYEMNPKVKREELMTLYNDVGWSVYTEKPDILVKAYDNSTVVCGAYDGEVLVGIIRGITDHTTILYIQDLLVLTRYQHQGIGRTLLMNVMEVFPQVRQKMLLTDDTKKTRRFYESCGFKSCDDGKIVGFINWT